MKPPKPRVSSSYLFALLAFILFVTILYCNDFNYLFTRSSSSSHLQQQQQPLLQPIPKPEKSNSNPPYSSSHLEQQQQPEPEPVVQPIPRIENINFNQPEQEPVIQPSHRTEKKVPFAVGEGGGCDVFNGKWMKDDSNRPIYEESECPYIQPQLTCQEHGRPEKEYQFWRWQPHDCSLASFNATFMLEKLRGKRMLFVGDSLNRGQYVSMICLLHRVIPEHAKSMETFDSLTVFRAKEYNATIEFYWAPFLLESNSDDAVIHRVTDRIVRKGSINKHGRYWLGADILVFNTYLWWITGMKMKILRGSFADDEKRNDIMEMETDDAYRMAMKSMVKWVEKNVDQKTTRVFFTSMSPSHGKSIEWGGDPDGNCYNQTTPIEDPTYWGDGSRKSIMKVIGEVFSKSQVPITFLNVTQLSEYRKDAHTSIYKKQWSPLTPTQLAHPASYADCTHWCLPGLQDTWNELLYTWLFYP